MGLGRPSDQFGGQSAEKVRRRDPMQATSTPQLAQSKPNALGAFLAAVALAVAIVAGVAISVSLAPATSVTSTQPGAAILPDNGALRITRAGEIGAATAAERSLAEQRRGEIMTGAQTLPSVTGALTPAQRTLLEHRRAGDPWFSELMTGAQTFPGVADNNMSDAALDALAPSHGSQFRGDRGYWRNHAQEKPSRFDTEGIHIPVSHGGGRAKAD
jgi:hypothetical protein